MGFHCDIQNITNDPTKPRLSNLVECFYNLIRVLGLIWYGNGVTFISCRVHQRMLQWWLMLSLHVMFDLGSVPQKRLTQI